MRFRLLAAALFALPFCLPAHADSFVVNGSMTDGTTFTGTFDINVTTGVLQGVNLTYLGDAYSTIIETAILSPGYTAYLGTGPSVAPEFILTVPDFSLVDYSGSSICSITAPCNHTVSVWYGTTSESSAVIVESGEISTAITPEPSSFMLLGTGLLGMLGVAKRRLA